DWREGLEVSRRLLEFGGMGHTMALHASEESVIREFALKAPAFRLVVNTPAPHGSIGHSTRLFPSMSLGCGTPGGNITSDNISPMNLLNIKRLAYERSPVNRADGTAEPARGHGETDLVHRFPALPSLAQHLHVASAHPASPLKAG